MEAQRDYGSRLTGIRRHEFTANVGGSLAAGAYHEIPLLRFIRSAQSGVDDVEPTATAGNNFQNPDVMNGSRVSNFQAKIIFNNQDSTASTITHSHLFDVYEIQTSFFDAHVWNNFASSLCPIDFDTSSTDEGEVDFKATPITLTDNNQKNSKFSQHYMRRIGRLEVPTGQRVIMNINRVPPKVRRSNFGMFWGLVVHNSSIVNDSDTLNVDITKEQSFTEIPSSERPPWLY
jgi:hypothetical protein